MKKYYADYILTSAHSSRSFPVFLKDGEFTVDEISGRVLGIKSRPSFKTTRNGNSKKKENKRLIIPGFINAHAHTDLTFNHNTETPHIFSKWVLSLIEKRKNLTAGEKIGLRVKAFKSFIKSGITTVSDIIDPASFYDIKDIKAHTGFAPRIKGFIELRGLDPACAVQKIEEFKTFLQKSSFDSTGISPHSIYSVSENLFEEILKLNEKLKLKIAVHAAEHSSETDFIKGKGGDIAENLLPALMLSKFSRPPVCFRSPVFYLDYLKVLGAGTSLIHANEIDEEDIDIIKQNGADIIHCPRSNAFFNSRKLPLKKILEKGIQVSIGTDGLFSNESLSILDELKYAGKIHPEIPPSNLLAAATVGGAKALSISGVTGTIEPDSFADFIVFRIDKNVILNEENIYDLVISLKETDIMSVAIGGNIVYDSRACGFYANNL